ncbi:MAG: Dabb family protein [Candidatus Latescibacteria bacterium]|nr:Dabb family protein [Candidatus Latescibacterota bacterium]
MIRHTVVFKLKHAPGSPEEKNFLHAACQLAHIDTVQNFECLRQVSGKNHYTFGLSMEFDSSEAYQTYNDHPDHIRFVENRWLVEVADFMEIDYEPYQAD